MTHNLGKTDRVVRAVLGPTLLGYGWYAESWLACIGVWLLMTVFSKWCPVYSVFGFYTSPKDDKDSNDSATESLAQSSESEDSNS